MAEADTGSSLVLESHSVPQNSFLLSHTVFRKTRAVDYVSGINTDLVKSHLERLVFQKNAFKPNTLNGGCLH